MGVSDTCGTEAVRRPGDHLPLRRVAIDFDGVPFDWHPSRPGLARAANAVSWAAVTFERRLCAAFREALPRVDDPYLGAEVEDFIAQEATHSRVHRAHIRALEASYPGLSGLDAELDALAEVHLSDMALMDRLALGATVEGALAPLGRYLVAERARVFAGADVRVAALFLWHFCEEIEHRSTALKLYRALGGSWARRMRATRALRRLQSDGTRLVGRRFADCIPAGQGGLPELPVGWPLARLGVQLADSLRPGHDTGGRAMPDWAQAYLSRIRLGTGPVEAWAGESAGGDTRSRTLVPS